MLALYISCKSGYMPEMFVTIKYKPFWPHFIFFLSSPVHSLICLMSFDLCGCSYKHLENEIDQSCLLSYLLSQFFCFSITVLFYKTFKWSPFITLSIHQMLCIACLHSNTIQIKSFHTPPIVCQVFAFFWKRN